MTRHSGRASVALLALNELDPALAALSLWCTHRDTESGPVAETCGQVICYGPAFDQQPAHIQIGLVAHHVLHVALAHAGRLQAVADRQPETFDPELWTLAADAIINEVLLAADFAIPRPAVTLTGLLAATLSEAQDPATVLAEWDVERLYVHLADQDTTRRKAADYARQQSFRADLRAVEARQEDTDAAADWRQHVSRAMQAGRLAGRGVGLFGHRLADLPVPRTPWEAILRGIVTRAVTAGPTVTSHRPSRRWMAGETLARARGAPVPAFQPGTRQMRDIPRIVVGLDTSSSIGPARRAMFLGEIAGIARRSGAEVHVIAFDETTEPAVRLDPGQGLHRLVTMTTRQGGGTDFRPLLAAARGIRPSILVVLTDLEGEAGPPPSDLRVLWALPAGAELPKVPFGQVISLAR
jgi:predicted metal-dependent peptidase